MRSLVRVACATVVFLTSLALAPAVSAQEAQPVTTGDPSISVENLEHFVVPLTKADLEIEAGAWVELVKAKALEIAQAQMAGGDAAALKTLNDDRSALVARLEVVAKAFRDKGGDIADIEAYMGVVDVTRIDPTDASGIWLYVEDWVMNPEGGLQLALNILWFLLTLIAFKILSGIASKVVSKAMARVKNVSDLLRSFFANVVGKLIFFIGLVIAVNFLGVDTGPFLAAIGAMGFIIGFALQGTLSNFACGIMILLYRPYDIGDVVTVAGTTGKVEAMTLVSTSMLTPDNQRVIVPNGSIWGDTITNITANDTRRVDMVFGIGYSDDIDKAMKVLEDVVTGHELVLKDPEPAIKVHELADSSVNFVVRPWTKTSDYWAVYWDLQRLVKQRFDAEGISIPFPQQDVYMHQVSAS